MQAVANALDEGPQGSQLLLCLGEITFLYKTDVIKGQLMMVAKLLTSNGRDLVEG